MATIMGTANNDSWTVVQAGTFTLDGLSGVDTLNLGTSKQSDYVIAQQSDGAVTVDSVSGASASYMPSCTTSRSWCLTVAAAA
jgi:hypothetical protein